MSHLTLAANEKAFNKLVEKVRDNFHLIASNSGSFGPFTVSYAAGVRLGGGSIDLQSDGTIRIDEMDIIYDPLEVTFGIDIPTVHIGGFCIIPKPWGGCFLRAPEINLFDKNPDASVTIDFSSLFQSEISGAFKIKPKYKIDPARGTLTDHDAHDANVANKWEFYLEPEWIDIDIIDVADTVANIVEKIADAIIDALLGSAPSWAKAIAKAILSPVIALIRTALDIVDDADEWLSNLLGTSLGLFDFIVEKVGEYLAKKFPVFSIEDPYKMLEGKGTLIPVLVPIRNLAVNVNDIEVVVSADIG